MHGECACRAGYYMECGKVENSGNNNEDGSQDTISQSKSTANKGVKSKRKKATVCAKDKQAMKIFCERHRPFKLIKEIKDKQQTAIEELQKFCKSMRKAVDIMSRVPYKCRTVVEKRWREKDKKTLIDRVRDRFFLLRRLKVNIIRVDPNKQRKRKAKHSKLISKRIKTGENSEAKSHDFASVDNSSVVSHSVSKSELKEPLYKLATPCFPPEPDWSITLSRNDFPWYDIKFDDFTSQECFEMYRSLVNDEDTFNKKVRREKNAMINKLMKENRKVVKKAKMQGINAHQWSKKELKKQAEQLKHLREAQLKESTKMHQLQKEMTKEELAEYNKRIAEQNKMY